MRAGSRRPVRSTDRFAPPASAADVAALLGAVVEGRVSRTAGRELLERSPGVRTTGGGPARERRSCPISIGDDVLLGTIDAVIAANPKAVEDYRAGKPVAGFFVGQVMKATGGAADAARVSELVRERLDAAG